MVHDTSVRICTTLRSKLDIEAPHGRAEGLPRHIYRPPRLADPLFTRRAAGRSKRRRVAPESETPEGCLQRLRLRRPAVVEMVPLEVLGPVRLFAGAGAFLATRLRAISEPPRATTGPWVRADSQPSRCGARGSTYGPPALHLTATPASGGTFRFLIPAHYSIPVDSMTGRHYPQVRGECEELALDPSSIAIAVCVQSHTTATGGMLFWWQQSQRR
jgi:hypothetical protein